MDVPVHTTLDAVYGSTGDAPARFAAIRAAFVAKYGAPPDCYARAPGRVNLIGEHIDYEGYSVLPMALELDTVVAIRRHPAPAGPADPKPAGGRKRKGATDADAAAPPQPPAPPRLRIATLDDALYPPAEFAADPAAPIDVAHHTWAHYVVCGYKGVWEHLAATAAAPAPAAPKKKPPPRGARTAAAPPPLPRVESPCSLDVLVDGRVPPGAGVSSSSALVVASALAVMAAHGLAFPQPAVAELACACERHVGTLSGGMDQAISVLAHPGVAQLVSFHPLAAYPVTLPPESAFVVANSLARSDKAVSAATHYNYRVVECRLAAAALAVGMGASPETARGVMTLLEVETRWAGGEAAAALSAVHTHLTPGGYTPAEVESLLGTSLESMFGTSPAALRAVAAAKAAPGGKSLMLKERACHVFAEALRVRSAAAVCAAPPGPPLPGGGPLSLLGQLMRESHASCRDLYSCSCPELEELVTACQAAGALGARLTGAGWGGCAVALIREADTDAFLTKLRATFYAPRVAAGTLAAADVSRAAFASKPAGGAAILRLP